MVSNGKEYDHLRELDDGKEYNPVKCEEDVRKLYEVVRQNLHKAYEKYSRTFNLRTNKRHCFSQGEWVYKHDMHLSDKSKNFVAKFGTKYSKARIRDVIGSNSYILEDENGRRISGTFHGSLLKKA